MMGLLRHRVRHRTFLSYHPEDRGEVRAFVDFFDHTRDVFLVSEPGVSDDGVVASFASPHPGSAAPDVATLVQRLRMLYLADSTVTLVLIGVHTWQSYAVDWEILGSLTRYGAQDPNGLLGVVLPSAGNAVTLPLRLQLNLGSGYAQVYPYTLDIGKLARAINDAFAARTTRSDRISNPPPIDHADA